MTTTPARWLRQGIAALAGSLLMLSFSSTALAGAPQVKTQAPGFYRMMLGDFEVTALFDGTLDLEPKKLLTNTTQEQVGKLLDRGFEKDAVPTSVNGYLINTGSKLVLVDTGAGGLFGPTLGNLQANLKAAGYQPDQVDDVLITHMHGDHVGGLVQDGKLVFPNATIHAGQEDADFWLNKVNLEKASAEMKGFFQGAMASLNPYVEAGKFKGMKGGTELAPGIRAVPAHGHTPGHNIYVVESKGQKLVLWGDLMHVAAVQFAQPQITISFDVDSKPAAAERKKAYADAAKGRYLVGSAHLPFPGLGHVRAEGKGYVWVPVDYQQIR
ncbi:MBL fold metallo-hydrolase [Variovorax sp. NFACC27]|uniref:MBL fold metallo-hydrolase n=1 Tax=unclassified Variovorax TaxID=663243 RepID=UPI00089568D5|nr:Glyoxylase, beta-lactamase superfamily II [Variovorax sp. NFACC28]SEG28149.1 Glyoxylase, beta-lactamase superfamily II [Variovorax sp. NFACC29]SFC44174.1 Glyoxylase, beta-lactamase superfamily II [Variovorax sp. NFACC26]SFF91396.1 Glyoxylase, beta-lactamase superfamily II [Variovorax sp. NFACC27]